MNTIDFFPLTFSEIPEQDNPAFGGGECFMIVKENGTCPHSVVLHIKPDPIESVTHIAKFWRHDLALIYCNSQSAVAVG